MYHSKPVHSHLTVGPRRKGFRYKKVAAGAVFVIGAAITAVFWPIVNAKVENGRTLNSRRREHAIKVLEHNTAVSQKITQMQSQLALFWKYRNNRELWSKHNGDGGRIGADVAFQTTWNQFNDMAWWKYSELLAAAQSSKEIPPGELIELYKESQRWTDTITQANRALWWLRSATLDANSHGLTNDAPSKEALDTYDRANKQVNETSIARGKIAERLSAAFTNNVKEGILADISSIFSK